MTRATDLAAEFESACGAFTRFAACLTPEEWRKVAGNHPDIRHGDDERRQVGLVAHHVGDMIPMLAELVRRRTAGEEMVPLTPADVDAINARHAAGCGNPDQAETVAMVRDNGTRAAELIRGLDDGQLGRPGPNGMSAEQVVRRVVIGHFAWHEASIRATVGR